MGWCACIGGLALDIGWPEDSGEDALFYGFSFQVLFLT